MRGEGERAEGCHVTPLIWREPEPNKYLTPLTRVRRCSSSSAGGVKNVRMILSAWLGG